MATQIKVSSATGNVTVQLSRTVIGTVVTANTANTANYANFAGTATTANNLNAATTANVIIGGGLNGYVLQTNGAGATSWVAQAGGGGTQPGGANTEVQYNDAGTMAGDPAFTFNDVTSTLTTGTISATNIGNITPTNLDGNVANVLRGDGTFAADAGGSYGDSNVVTLLDAFGSNTITTTGLITANGGGLSNITGANVTGTVASATLASFATTANAVAGANVTGEVAFAAVANSVALANVAGAGNIASINIDGNVSNVLRGDGTFGTDLGQNETLAQVLTNGNTSGGTGITMSTTDKISFNDAQVNVHSSTDGTLNADADVEIQFTTPYIDMAADAVNMDGNLVVTGTATTGNLEVVGVNGNITLIPDSEIVDGRRFAKVSRATETVTLTAGSFLIGEFYEIVTTGTTDFTLIGAPDSNPGTFFDATGVGTGTGTAKYNNASNEAYVSENYTTQAVTDIIAYSNTSSGQIAKGASFGFNSYNAIGNTSTDKLVSSQISFAANPQSANLIGPQTGTVTSMTMGGPGTDGFLTVIGSGASDSYGSEAWKQFQYRPKAMGFIRRNGNADSRLSSAANDETSLNFYNTQNRTGRSDGQLWNYPAKMGSKVDPTWVDPGGGSPSSGVPNGLFFVVVGENFGNLEHRMYANGDTTFNSSGGGTPITLGYNGVITGDGGGLSNISTSAGSKILNGTSNVDITTSGGNITMGVAGFTNVLDVGTTVTTVPSLAATQGNITAFSGQFVGDGGGLSNVSATASPGGFFDSVQFNNNGALGGDAVFTYSTGSKQLTLNGTSGNPGPQSTAQMLINNGSFTINQEEIAGGVATFSFNNYYGAGNVIAPMTYFRARGTRNAPTAIGVGDQVFNEGFNVKGPTNNFQNVGSISGTLNAVNADGNVSMNYNITTNQSDQYKNDKITLDTSLLTVAGNVTMGSASDNRLSVKRLYQAPQTLSQLQAIVGAIAGERGFITDGTSSGAVNFGGLAVDGGTVLLPVYFDGSDWRFG